MDPVQVAGFKGSSLVTALNTRKYVEALGYCPEGYMTAVVEGLQGQLSNVAQTPSQTAVSAGVSVDHTTSFSTPLVGKGNSSAVTRG